MSDQTPKFDYVRYKNPAIDVETLDTMAKSFFSSASISWISMIMMGFKFIVALAYIWARNKLVDQELLTEKQQYEQYRINSNKADVDSN